MLGEERYFGVPLEVIVVHGLLASAPNVHLAIDTSARLVVGHLIEATRSVSARQCVQPRVHLNALVVRFQVAVLNAKNVQLGLRLGLLAPQGFLDVRHELHRLSDLECQALVLLLHVLQALDLLGKDVG